MTRSCDLTGKTVLVGNKVSHSNRKSKKNFRPNLQNTRLFSVALDMYVSLRLAANTIRTIDFKGGLDNFILTRSAKELTATAAALKTRIKKALLKKQAGA